MILYTVQLPQLPESKDFGRQLFSRNDEVSFLPKLVLFAANLGRLFRKTVARVDTA